MAPMYKRRKVSHNSNSDSYIRTARKSTHVSAEANLNGHQTSDRPGYTASNDASIRNEDASSDDESEAENGHSSSYASLIKSFGRSISRPKASGKNPTKQTPMQRKEGDHEIDTVELSDASQADAEERDLAITESGLDADDEDAEDPFVIHIDHPDQDHLITRIDAAIKEQWQSETLNADKSWKQTLSYPGSEPQLHTELKRKDYKLDQYHIKQKLRSSASKIMPHLEKAQAQIAPALFNYVDILYGGRTPFNSESLRQLVCLHALNHILKTRDRIIKHTARLARDPNTDLEFRDQGFTRPKVLILLETRQSCVRYINAITSFFAPEQQENRKRFQDAFEQSTDHFTSDKPADFRELFDGNDDNDFRLGIKFTRKTLKYYSHFYGSDIIFASPLGLRRAINPDDPKKQDADFLSSIELLILDQADAMLMQNWDHVKFAFSKLNLQPTSPHDCDFSRVRQWCLDGHARYRRQTIVLSAYLTPELNSLFNTNMHNTSGRIKYQPRYTGTILDSASSLSRPITQTFTRFHSPSAVTDPDARFKYFTSAVLPSLLTSSSGKAGTILFIPNYLDYTRLRNYLTHNASASSETTASGLSIDVQTASITEYTPTPALSRARSHFAAGTHPLLLYTGRAHHFRRLRRVRGASRIVFYGVPVAPAAYGEIVEFLGEGGYGAGKDGNGDRGRGEVRVLFSKWDALALERVVGSERVGRMVREGQGDVFEFR